PRNQRARTSTPELPVEGAGTTHQRRRDRRRDRQARSWATLRSLAATRPMSLTLSQTTVKRRRTGNNARTSVLIIPARNARRCDRFGCSRRGVGQNARPEPTPAFLQRASACCGAPLVPAPDRDPRSPPNRVQRTAPDDA